MTTITILSDDRCENDKCLASHGLSIIIENDNFKVLFDVGQNDYFLKNAITLNKKLDDVNCIVLSHGHYDHSLGLKYLNSRQKIICHPNCVIWRKSKRTNEYNGLPFTKEEFENKFDIKYSNSPYKITNNIIFLGEIERLNDFECKKFPSTLKNGSDDIALDDSGLVIKTPKGLVIISGCGHSGICNTIEYAKKITRENKILSVIGGFHLKDIDEQTKKTIQYFKDNQIKNVYLGHCNADIVCQYFKEQLSNDFNIKTIGVGLTITF